MNRATAISSSNGNGQNKHSQSIENVYTLTVPFDDGIAVALFMNIKKKSSFFTVTDSTETYDLTIKFLLKRVKSTYPDRIFYINLFNNKNSLKIT